MLFSRWEIPGAQAPNRLVRAATYEGLGDAGGYPQAQLGNRLGVSRQTVNAIETGRYHPSLPLAFRIGRLFQLPIEEIFDPDDLPPAD